MSNENIAAKSKTAQTARQVRPQGCQPNAPSSGDSNVSSGAGPHDKPELTNEMATEGTGMLPEPGKSDDNDMAPGG